jgi:hypothetical protein
MRAPTRHEMCGSDAKVLVQPCRWSGLLPSPLTGSGGSPRTPVPGCLWLRCRSIGLQESCQSGRPGGVSPASRQHTRDRPVPVFALRRSSCPNQGTGGLDPAGVPAAPRARRRGRSERPRVGAGGAASAGDAQCHLWRSCRCRSVLRSRDRWLSARSQPSDCPCQDVAPARGSMRRQTAIPAPTRSAAYLAAAPRARMQKCEFNARTVAPPRISRLGATLTTEKCRNNRNERGDDPAAGRQMPAIQRPAIPHPGVARLRRRLVHARRGPPARREKVRKQRGEASERRPLGA